MAIIVSGVSSGGVIKHTAPAGLHQAVCVDAIDMGQKQTPWGEKPKIVLRWQIPVKDPDGKLHLVQKWYTKSLSEKATLRHDLEAWRGKEFTGAELRGFDVERLVDVNCQVLIVHKKSADGKVWANVQAIMPAAKGQKLVAKDYDRNASEDEAADDEVPEYEGPPPASELPDDPPF